MLIQSQGFNPCKCVAVGLLRVRQFGKHGNHARENIAKASFMIVRKEVQPSKHNKTAVSPGRTRKWTTGTPEGWHRKSKGWGCVRWTRLCLGPEIGQSERDQQQQGASSPYCWLSWHKAEASLRSEVKVKQAFLTTRTHYSGIKHRYNPRVHKHLRATSGKILKSRYWCRRMFGS